MVALWWYNFKFVIFVSCDADIFVDLILTFLIFLFFDFSL